MKDIAVFDLAAFIWDRAHFDANTDEYYNLMEVMPELYVQLSNYRIPVAFREEVIDEIRLYFPYDKIPGKYYDFQNSTLRFLTNCKKIDYPKDDLTKLTAKPELEKPFYEASTNLEVRSLITYLYKSGSGHHKILSLNFLWGKSKNLTLKDILTVDIESVICDDSKQHQSIAKSFKKIFVHHEKHNEHNSAVDAATAAEDESASPLSCYNERDGDTAAAQELLDKSVQIRNKGKGFFAHDVNNKTYVKFVATNGNIYHGFDIILEGDDLTDFKKIYYKK
ncbi:MAG TPA: hypothetical protein VGN20_10395 [Mucilaginibacter sp.]|jgi:hypothetical protein